MLFCPKFFGGKGTRPPRCVFRAASARKGLFSFVDWTQDVVSDKAQDYARQGPLSRVWWKFSHRELPNNFNRLDSFLK